MDTSQSHIPSPHSHAMRAGIEVGLLFAADFVLRAQQVSHAWTAYLAILVEVFIVLAVIRMVQHFKYTECSGKISFGQAYRYIMWLFIYSSLIASLLRFAYLQWIDRIYLTVLFDIQMKVIDEIRKTMPVDAAAVEMVRQLFSPIRYAMVQMLSDVLSGALLALIVAPFISRRDIPFRRSKNNDNQADN